MADKKISALTQVSDSDIGSDDLLHIVDNPGGTPVNKKMTIGQLFENIPTHLAVDDIETLTATDSTLASPFCSFIDLSGESSQIDYTLDDGSDNGQLKVIVMSTAPGGGASAVIDVTNWGSTASSSNQITLNAIGEAVVCYWSGSKWFLISNYNATIA